MIVLRNAAVIDGTGAQPLPGATVVVNGNRIEAVGCGIASPSGADIVIDLHGKAVLPGFIDAHVHLGGTDRLDYPSSVPRIAPGQIKQIVELVIANGCIV